MSELDRQFHDSLVNVLLCVADEKLFLGHRNSDWTGIAPILEADIAFSSLAQDDIAHASAFYELISTITGQDSDQIAYGRTENEYRCADIVTKSDEFQLGICNCSPILLQCLRIPPTATAQQRNVDAAC